jgi:uncharacterized heparinase superfamily protein
LGHTTKPWTRVLHSRIRGVPRGVARRAGIRMARYQHALRPIRSDAAILQRALVSGQDIASFLTSLRRLGERRFFIDGTEALAIIRHLEQTVPGWKERTLADADRIADRIVRLLGADEIDVSVNALGNHSLPWHEDRTNDYYWNPRTFYKEVSIPYGRAEAKVPWELSRFQHLPTLGIAYLASGSGRYAEEAVAQIEDWIAGNPPGYGINWTCTMDVAIRAVNWLWTYHLIAGAPGVTDDFRIRFFASVAVHGRHIHRNLEIYEAGLTTNHTLADYVGLVYIGLLLPEFREASTWAELGIAGMVECMASQVAPDGVDFENSISYHRLALEMFLGVYLLAERNGRLLPEVYRASLERMFEFVYHYTRPDGLAPLIGDSDDGRLQILSQYFDWRPQDHRYLLGVGAAMFGREDFAALAHGSPGAVEEAAWLLGTRAAGRLARGNDDMPEPRSRAFQHSGRYVMRHKNHYAIVSTDEVGTAGLGNHKHNDIFSYELCVDGIAVVVDAGSFLYVSDPTWRDRFRSTSAHNTLVVDRTEQNEMVGPFAMRRDASVTVTVWSSQPKLAFLDATHSGYERLPEPVSHRRRIWFRMEPFAWLVVDALIGCGSHAVESFLHLAPGGEVARARDRGTARLREIEATLEDLRAKIELEHPLAARPDAAVSYLQGTVGILIVPLNWPSSPCMEPGWVAPRWGQRISAPVIRLSGEIACGALVGYLILAL